MLNVSIMASLRNLPLVAEFGYSSLFFFVIVGLGFLVPCALVSAELATGWPKDGGIYIWVREAFGDRWGFFAVWMQWVHNVTWFPAILSFVASTFAYVFLPEHYNNPYYILAVILILYWGMTLINYLGIKISSVFSTIGVIAGTIIPGLFIISLGISWILMDNPVQIHFSLEALIPKAGKLDNYVFLGGLFLAFAGLEVSAGYAGEVKDPQKNYPKAIYLGIADGAKNNWTFLENHTDAQLIDFFHATEYLANVAFAAHSGKTNHYILCIIWLDLEEICLVYHA
jgi:amino acid transporter